MEIKSPKSCFHYLVEYNFKLLTEVEKFLFLALNLIYMISFSDCNKQNIELTHLDSLYLYYVFPLPSISQYKSNFDATYYKTICQILSIVATKRL